MRIGNDLYTTVEPQSVVTNCNRANPDTFVHHTRRTYYGKHKTPRVSHLLKREPARHGRRPAIDLQTYLALVWLGTVVHQRNSEIALGISIRRPHDIGRLQLDVNERNHPHLSPHLAESLISGSERGLATQPHRPTQHRYIEQCFEQRRLERCTPYLCRSLAPVVHRADQWSLQEVRLCRNSVSRNRHSELHSCHRPRRHRLRGKGVTIDGPSLRGRNRYIVNADIERPTVEKAHRDRDDLSGREFFLRHHGIHDQPGADADGALEQVAPAPGRAGKLRHQLRR